VSSGLMPQAYSSDELEAMGMCVLLYSRHCRLIVNPLDIEMHQN
jgi:hypothetical protein